MACHRVHVAHPRLRHRSGHGLAAPAAPPGQPPARTGLACIRAEQQGERKKEASQCSRPRLGGAVHRQTKGEDQTVVNRGGPRAGKAVPSHCSRCASDRTISRCSPTEAGGTTGGTCGAGACNCKHKEQSSPCGPRACGRGASSSPAWLTTTNLTAPEAPQTNSSDWGWISGAAPAVPTTHRNHASTRREISGEERKRCMGVDYRCLPRATFAADPNEKDFWRVDHG